jgi:hypothetical protein
VPRCSTNRLTEALRAVCAKHALAEKWLLAPSRRVGMQWLDAVARSGQPVLNVRVESPQTMALLRLAAPALDREGLTFLRGLRREVLVGRLFAQLRERGEGYLSTLEPSPDLTAALSRALRDLRLAGVTAAGLRAGSFEVAAKGREMQALLAAYEEQLRRSAWRTRRACRGWRRAVAQRRERCRRGAGAAAGQRRGAGARNGRCGRRPGGQRRCRRWMPGKAPPEGCGGGRCCGGSGSR